MAKLRESRPALNQRSKKHRGHCIQPINGHTLRTAVSWVADARIFDHLQRHGNTRWRTVDLIMLSVVWVWSDKTTLTAAFREAQHWSTKVLGRAAVGTYQGLLGALVTWTGTFLPLIWCRLQDLMREHGQAHWRVGRWMALAVDGSRVSVPRTKGNERAFCAPNYGKGQTAKYRKKKTQGKRVRKKAKEKMRPVKPQIWTTLMWHMGMQMPWSWRSGPSNSSERHHFTQMLREQEFPENTLFCADAGFVGYDLWKGILDQGHNFLIRVGANVKLLRKLGYARERDGIVYCWPDRAARQKQPPLALRLLHFKLGKCHVYLVTNVLHQNLLSDKQAIQLYQLRWGVELQFRAIKQTFGRRKLRSKTPERALVELDWSLLGLWMVQLFAVKEQIEIGEVPEHCSVSLAIEVVRRTIQRWSEHPLPQEALRVQLQAATKDTYQRRGSKKARYRPDFKDKPSAGKPKILTATREHRLRLALYLNTVA